MSHIFISYSRKDVDHAGKIVQALADNNLDTWVDWESIPKGEDWWGEIQSGIEGADAFLVLISLDSVSSTVCGDELKHAIVNGKRILPIILHEPDRESVPEVLSKLNWIFCRDGVDDFEKVIQEINETIHTDYEWLKFHTELQVKALKWQRSDYEKSLLLRGKELDDAENMLGLKVGCEPHPVDLQRTYLLRSRQAVNRQRRQITISLGFGVIAMAILAVFAWGQRNSALTSEATAIAERNTKAIALVNEKDAVSTAQAESTKAAAAQATAEEQAQIAFARKLANQAQALFNEEYSKQNTAILLAIQSVKASPLAEASPILSKVGLVHPVAYMKHRGPIVSVAFSPDSKYIVSGSGTIRVWEASTGTEIARMNHDGSVSSVAFSPDGKYLVSGSSDGTARVWKTSTGVEIARINHDHYVLSVAFSPNGKHVVSRSRDDTTRVWEASTGIEIARMNYDDYVGPVAFSPDGKYLVSGSSDGTPQIWKTSTGVEIARMNHDHYVFSVAFSPNGKYVVSGSRDGTARVWEASTGVEIARMTHDHSVTSVAFGPGGKYVVSRSWDGTARIWEVSTGVEVARMNQDHYVLSVAFSPNGKYVISGGRDNTARVRNAFTGTEIARMTHNHNVTSVAFSPNGKYVVSGSSDGTAQV